MQTRNALDIALQLYRQPALARKVRRNSLPPRVLSVIRIAAGSEEELAIDADHTPEEIQDIREAAIFFLQNCLFQSGGDSYRMLGVEHDATVEEIRQHKRWLLKWLHPDLSRNTWEAAYLQRVLAAWQDIVGDAAMPETIPPSEGLVQGPRRSPPRYYRHRFSSYDAAPFAFGRMLRKGALIFGLSFVVFLAFRQSNGNVLTKMFDLLVPLGHGQW
jgi:hypothetical protein